MSDENSPDVPETKPQGTEEQAEQETVQGDAPEGDKAGTVTEVSGEAIEGKPETSATSEGPEAEKVEEAPPVKPKAEKKEAPPVKPKAEKKEAPVKPKAEKKEAPVKPKAEKKEAPVKPKAETEVAPPEAPEGTVEPPTEEKGDGTEIAAKGAEGKPMERERTFADELREEYGDIETARLDVLPDLERKRDRLNSLAEEHKSKRDRLNSMTKQLAEERDRLNSQVRELVQTANDHRNQRNKLNQEVKESKVLRDELNKKANDLNEVVAQLKKEKFTETGGPSLGRLRNELKALEFKAMTNVLTADKEKEIVTTIQRIQGLIKDQEQRMEENREVRQAIREARTAKEDAERQHKLVSELARAAQTEHDSMIELYENADDFRKQADDCQQRFIVNKQLADAEHKDHIELIRKVHDYDKFISGIRRRERRMRKDRQEKAQKKVAEDMMDRFKKGEKLSTEDLLSLQTERY